MERDQVQERPELHEESQSSHVEDAKTVGISDEGDERNATASNDRSAAREPWIEEKDGDGRMWVLSPEGHLVRYTLEF